MKNDIRAFTFVVLGITCGFVWSTGCSGGSGSGSGGPFLSSADADAATPTSRWKEVGDDLYYNSGRVSVGTSTALHQFDVGNTVGLNGVNGDGYLNFGAVPGEPGHGVRENGGIIEVKDIGGSWRPIPAETNASSNAYEPFAPAFSLHANAAEFEGSITFVRFIAPRTGAYSKVSFFKQQGAAGVTLFGGIYTVEGNKPGTQLMAGTGTTTTGAKHEIVNLDFLADITLLEGEQYYVALLVPSGSANLSFWGQIDSSSLHGWNRRTSSLGNSTLPVSMAGQNTISMHGTCWFRLSK